MERNHLCNYSRRYYEERFFEIILNNEETPFKDISYLELLQPFCSAEHNHLCNLVKQCFEEQFCEIILNLDPWLRRNDI